MTIAIYPWEDIDMAVREQAEAEIWNDEEFQAWLDEAMSEQAEGEEEPEPEYIPFQQPASYWADVLPDWEREEYIGM